MKNSFGDSNKQALNEEIEEIEFVSDEEEEEYLDSISKPKKRNSRKQMLNFFVYMILTQKTDSKKHLSQQEIIQILKEMPYELTVERKAISRAIHGLEDEMVGICSDPKGGAWYDSNKDEFGLVSYSLKGETNEKSN